MIQQMVKEDILWPFAPESTGCWILSPLKQLQLLIKELEKVPSFFAQLLFSFPSVGLKNDLLGLNKSNITYICLC